MWQCEGVVKRKTEDQDSNLRFVKKRKIEKYSGEDIENVVSDRTSSPRFSKLKINNLRNYFRVVPNKSNLSSAEEVNIEGSKTNPSDEARSDISEHQGGVKERPTAVTSKKS